MNLSNELHYPAILHSSLVVGDLNLALKFYCGTLNMPLADNRPDLGFDGAWLQLGNQQIHLMVLPNPDPVHPRPQHVGRDRHTAIQVNNLAGLKTALEQAGIFYTESKSGRGAVFCRDPDGNGLEFIQPA